MNAITIFQNPNEIQSSVALNLNASIESVYLRRARIASVSPNRDAHSKINLSMELKARHVPSKRGSLFIEVTFKLIGDPEVSSTQVNSLKSKPVFSIDCVFEAEYELREGFDPTQEQIDSFKDGNAMFNCWPYCREFVQETISRLGFPNLTLPLLRVQTASAEKKPKARQRKKPES